jgi:hypothetical protein
VLELQYHVVAGQILEPKPAEIAQHGTLRKFITGKCRRRRRHKHLAAIRSRRNSGGLVYRNPDELVALAVRLTAMDPNADPEIEVSRPVMRDETKLGVNGGPERGRRAVEDRECPVPLKRLDVTPV